MTTETLEQACDRVLIETMPVGLKEAIDAALAKGGDPGEILRRARHMAGGRRGVALQVEAYLGRPQCG